MISNVFLIKIFGLSGLFNTDLCQYRKKSALLTSRDTDFQPLTRCVLNNSNDILLRSRGPYHRHKSTKSG